MSSRSSFLTDLETERLVPAWLGKALFWVTVFS